MTATTSPTPIKPAGPPKVGTLTILRPTKIREASDRIRGFYWGKPGTRKTDWALSWPNPFLIYGDTQRDMVDKHADEIAGEIHPKTWADIQSIRPVIAARKLSELCSQKVETIVIDPFNYFMQMREDTLRNEKGAISSPSWGIYNMAGEEFIHECVNAGNPITKPDGTIDESKECYNLIITCHENIRTNEAGGIVRIDPHVKASLRDTLARHFSFFFYTEKVTKSVTVKKGSPPVDVMERKSECRIHTIPPDQWRTAFDRVAFRPGLKELPPTCQGDYRSLCRLWELKQRNSNE